MTSLDRSIWRARTVALKDFALLESIRVDQYGAAIVYTCSQAEFEQASVTNYIDF